MISDNFLVGGKVVEPFHLFAIYVKPIGLNNALN